MTDAQRAAKAVAERLIYSVTALTTFDRVAVQSLLLDKEVQGWLCDMGKLALLPVKRK